MDLLINDLKNLINSIMNHENKTLVEKYFKNTKNHSYVKENYKVIKNQKKYNELVYTELKKFDEANIPIIGLKGLFIQELYYNNSPRLFGDIDLLINSNDASEFYSILKNNGYSIKLKTLYDNPFFYMKYFPQQYMNNTQTLMLKNSQNISIDLHSNINITNAHFVKSHTNFNTEKLFENSKPFLQFKNIKVLELHDNICFLIRHLLKHHVFYGKTQTGLSTPLQHILDIAYMVNSNEFDEDILFEKITQYNLVPEGLFCINLYNNIFTNCKKITIDKYLEALEIVNYEYDWKPLLLESLNMNPVDLMIGDFSLKFPKLQKTIDFCEEINFEFINWCIQALVLSFHTKRLLK